MSTAQERIDFWKKGDVNTLAQHFHRYNEGSSQFERLNTLYLNRDDIDTLFPGGEEIHSFNISFALDGENSPTDRFTFRPVIGVRYANNREDMEKDFIPGVGLLTDYTDSEIVPLLFKEWVTKNWMSWDVTLIDDVFAASFEVPDTKPVKYVPKRLLAYHFRDDANARFFHFINKVKGSIAGFVFYPGVDMNKFNDKQEFSFAPVVAIQIPEATPEIVYHMHRLGLRSRLLPVGMEEVYYEYMMPCPSTC